MGTSRAEKLTAYSLKVYEACSYNSDLFKSFQPVKYNSSVVLGGSKLKLQNGLFHMTKV